MSILSATARLVKNKLQSKEFLKSSGKFIEATAKARMAMKVLPEEIIYPDTTAVWERELERVSTGDESFEKFYDGQLKSLSVLLSKAKKVEITPMTGSVKCPKCGKVMMRRKGKNGYFWGCSNYPECKETVVDLNGKPNFKKGKGK